jgi:hypothetical protein
MPRSKEKSNYWCWKTDVITRDKKNGSPPKFNEETMSYLVYQEEIYLAEFYTTGIRRTHWQGYVEFHQKTDLEGCVENLYPEGYNVRPHVEIRRGTAKQAADYCKPGKGNKNDGSEITGTCVEHGRINSRQGVRSDLTRAIAVGKANPYNPIEAIKETFPSTYVQYGRGINNLFENSRKIRKTAPTLSLAIYGSDSGTGKSLTAKRIAYQLLGGGQEDSTENRDLWESILAKEHPRIYYKGYTGEYWQKYNGQDILIWDDFTPASIGRTQFFDLLDSGTSLFNSKFGAVQFQSPIAIFTSNYPPESWFPGFATHTIRRIDCIIRIESKGRPIEQISYEDDGKRRERARNDDSPIESPRPKGTPYVAKPRIAVELDTDSREGMEQNTGNDDIEIY